ncbi:hypothetical protein Q4567_13940 [Aliiglaciecola sp. 2_MG-2023]|uniref:hypothetical protein n=1 Tax=unclassified Aliiglaciecola TaxID=2593648 RepID=UPI0026E40DE2|nr:MULTISPECIES: hypothetical protein [unclassified Aliiglaciecola]MDO6711830.1 hypothetical protein [Aliiglaciecola sp. 2_MG-2023]MDO6752996.1 hypothetical protein [Aliiglaciecola sp. 1_MG-2023]
MFVNIKRVLKLGVALSLIVVNSIVVLYIGRDRFPLPEWFSHPISYIDGLIDHKNERISQQNLTFENSKKQQNVEPRVSSKQASKKTANANLINHTELSASDAVCSDKRPKSASKQIYTWIDDSGTRHLSDKPRKIDSATPVSVIGTIRPEELSINYTGTHPPFSLQHKIESRVMANKALFAQITPKQLVKPITINFRLFTDVNNYSTYQKRIAPSVKSAIGFYASSINESVVMMNNDDQSVNTAVHEAMHSINRHWFGHMNRWLNEGIAEYAETSHTDNPLYNHWVTHIRKFGAIPLVTLFNANQHHWDTQRTEMYATSWAFVAFLMDKYHKTLSRLLQEENINGCNVVNISDMERISSQKLSVLQREFDNWLARV